MKCKRRVLGGLLLPFLLMAFSGCGTADQHRTATGAVVGSAVGGGVGALIDKENRYRGALIGSAAGAVIGTGVGAVLQKQKEAFDRIQGLEAREQAVILQEPPESYRLGDPIPARQSVQVQALNLRMQSEVLFARGSSALTPQGTMKVREIAQVLKDYPDSDVYIRRYTSSEGDDKVNYELSQRRAEVVRNELIAARVNPVRLFAQGMGSSNPVADNNTEAGRAQNRRVELTIVPRSVT